MGYLREIRGNLLGMSKKKEEGFFQARGGQVTIFIIVAILIVVGAVIYFFILGSSQSIQIPEEFQPVYTAFQTCLEDSVSVGADILQSQAGYIYLPEFEPGSEYMPFSSQLDFVGNPIPYWYYVSGNNLPREQVPSKKDMESQLEEYIGERVRGCNFNSYNEQGFGISLDEPFSRVTINDNNIEVGMEMNLNLERGSQSVLVRHHEVTVDSNLGNLYDSALEVYEQEREELFLEEYAIDNIRLYAPVDGIEISCSPLIWNADEVFDDLQAAIEANTLALNSEQSVDDYFLVDVPAQGEVRFIQSKEWPHSFEVTPSEENFLIANPLGNQRGMGILGFCYTPYHFVYSAKYPVLVQVYSDSGLEGDVFQFPVAVIVENNHPGGPSDSVAFESASPDLCLYKNSEMEVRVRDRKGNSIDAQISYECLGEKCNIGESSSGFFVGDFPRCANGFITARAEGFVDESILFSTNSPGSSVTIIMDKLYEKPVRLRVDDTDYEGEALIHFISDDLSKTIVYPEQRSVSLAEGEYEVRVQAYGDSSIEISETVVEQCIEVARRGIFGAIGLREEKCFEVEVPEQTITSVILGGGQQDYFILESDLTEGNILEINAKSFPRPENIEGVINNNLLGESSDLEINFV